jgi:hypothetical protein
MFRPGHSSYPRFDAFGSAPTRVGELLRILVFLLQPQAKYCRNKTLLASPGESAILPCSVPELLTDALTNEEILPACLWLRVLVPRPGFLSRRMVDATPDPKETPAILLELPDISDGFAEAQLHWHSWRGHGDLCGT